MFADELMEKAQAYFDSVPDLVGESPSVMLVDFVIEKFKQHRNYPASFTEDKVLSDMRSHISTMAMAVVDLYSKEGAEGEKAHNENGVNRTYENAYISKSIFNDIVPFVRSVK